MCVIVTLFIYPAKGQNDTSFYVSYKRSITGRIYFSQKFTSVKIRDKGSVLNYRPNTTLNMGVGATYEWATLNLAYGFGFLNPDRGQGKTKYLDLQFHNYGRKFLLDFFGQFYRGFFLAPKGYAMSTDQYYVRPDLRVNEVGVSIQYVLNYRRLSYRASFLQNEWQKKSAGSFLVGLELYTGRMRADSTIVPTRINKDVAATQLKRVNFTELGPNIGYAYTYVYKKNFFLTGSVAISLNFGRSIFESKDEFTSVSGFSPNTFFRGFAGYNSSKWAVSILYISNGVNLTSGENVDRIQLNTGNFRLNIVRRFYPGKKAKKFLKPVKDIEPR